MHAEGNCNVVSLQGALQALTSSQKLTLAPIHVDPTMLLLLAAAVSPATP